MSKKLVWILLVLALTLIASPAVRASKPVAPAVARHTIAIDPGHGGPDDVGSTACMELLASEGVPDAEMYLEKHVNLDIALRLETLLEADGATVVLTRRDDPAETLSNHDRAATANDAGAEVLVDLHLNGWTDPEMDGLYVLFGRARKDKAFALAMHDAMIENEALIATPDEFIDFGVRQLAAGVMLWTEMPSALLESAFISNAWECHQLSDGSGARQQEIAQAIHEALNVWFADPQSPWGGEGKTR